MSQFQNSVTVSASVNVTIVGFTTIEAEVSAGDDFYINGDGVRYTVASRTNGSPDSTVVLTGAYAGTPGTFTGVFQTGYTTDGIPKLARGDLETNEIAGRMASIIQTLLDDKSGYSGNGIYNGLCLINQKDVVLDAAAVSATNDEYPIDMHKTTLSGVTGTHQWLSTSQPTGKNGNSLRYAATSTASGQIGSRQIIENYVLYAGTVRTYGRWVKSNSTDARIVIDDGVTKTAGAPHTGGGGWELLTATATIGASPTKLECNCSIASSILANVSITTGDYIEFTDVRLDLGSHRLSGDREYGEDLALCQRYYWEISGQGERVCIAAYWGTTIAYGAIPFPVEMLVAPTIGFGSATDVQVFVAGAALITSGIGGVSTKSLAEMAFTTASATSGTAGFVRLVTSGSPRLTFTAEL